MLSKGSLQCDRSAYGLYSGFGGGMAFYVSSQAQYTISPEVPSAIVWDGAWHHVIGSYDGDRVRLWIDGSQVGDGHAGEHGDRLHDRQQGGLHRDLPRARATWASSGASTTSRCGTTARPAATTGPVIAPVPDTPTTHRDRRCRRRLRPRRPVRPRRSPGCLRVTLSRRTIPVRRKTRLTATVRRDGRRVAGVRIVASGKGVTITGARTNRKGTTKIAVRARKAGRLKVKVRGQKSSCPALTVRAR